MISNNVLVLVPEASNLSSLSQFRPIKLCSVVYNIISRFWKPVSRTILSEIIFE